MQGFPELDQVEAECVALVTRLGNEPPYRHVDSTSVLANLRQRVARASADWTRAGKNWKEELDPQARYAFFEQIFGLLKDGPEQIGQELFEYLYWHVGPTICDRYPNDRDQAAQLAAEVAQRSVEMLYELVQEGQAGDPANFWDVVHATCDRQFTAISRLTRPPASPASEGPRRENSPTESLAFAEPFQVPPFIQVLTQTDESSLLNCLKESIGRLRDLDHRHVATFMISNGQEYEILAARLNKTESFVSQAAAHIFDHWKSDLLFHDCLQANSRSD
jgi:hypothetical protein